MDVFLLALDAEVDVIRQGKDHIFPELVSRRFVGQIHDGGGGFQHFLGNAVKQPDLFLAHIVEGAVDLAQRHIVGRLHKPDALAEGDDLVVVAVQTQGDIVVDVFDHPHLFSPTTKKSRELPHYQMVRESLRRVTNLT